MTNNNETKYNTCKKLSDESGRSIAECRKILEYCDYDYDAALYFNSLIPAFMNFDNDLIWEELDKKMEEYLKNR